LRLEQGSDILRSISGEKHLLAEDAAEGRAKAKHRKAGQGQLFSKLYLQARLFYFPSLSGCKDLVLVTRAI
jgi:hypothetical protein